MTNCIKLQANALKERIIIFRSRYLKPQDDPFIYNKTTMNNPYRQMELKYYGSVSSLSQEEEIMFEFGTDELRSYFMASKTRGGFSEVLESPSQFESLSCGSDCLCRKISGYFNCSLLQAKPIYQNSTISYLEYSLNSELTSRSESDNQSSFQSLCQYKIDCEDSETNNYFKI